MSTSNPTSAPASPKSTESRKSSILGSTQKLRSKSKETANRHRRTASTNVSTTYVQLHRGIDADHARTVSQIGLGNVHLERLSRASRKINNLHRTMANEIANIIKEEQDRLAKERMRSGASDAFEPFGSTLTTAMNYWDTLLKGYQKFADDGDTNCDALDASVAKLKTTYNDVSKKEKNAMYASERIHSSMDKSHVKHGRKLNDLLPKINLESDKDRELSPSADAKKLAKKEIASVEKAITTLEKYIKELDDANAAFCQFKGSDMLPLLQSMEDALKSQNLSLTTFWRSFSKSLDFLSKNMSITGEELSKVIGSLESADTASISTVNQIRFVIGEKDVKFYNYEMSVDLEQLQLRLKMLKFRTGEMGPKDQESFANEVEEEKVEEAEEEAKNGGVIEPISVEETMKMEKQVLGIESDEPLIVTVLLDKIRSLNGLRAEGIFRLSPDYVALQKFKGEVFRGRYSLEGVTDPHLPAELLKVNIAFIHN
jgi:hypothetical protein